MAGFFRRRKRNNTDALMRGAYDAIAQEIDWCHNRIKWANSQLSEGELSKYGDSRSQLIDAISWWEDEIQRLQNFPPSKIFL